MNDAYIIVYFFIPCFILWVARTVIVILNQTHLWQLKEYRFDRMREHLLSQKKILSLFFFKISILFLLPFIFFDFNVFYFLLLVILYFVAEIAIAVYQFFNKSFKKPRFTPKAVFISSGSFFLQLAILGFAFLYPLPPELRLNPNMAVGIWYFFKAIFPRLILLFLTPFFVALMVFFLKPLTIFAKKRIYLKAAQKIAGHKNLITIGITGSYGKTSTKEFLSQILSQKYRVLKTAEHVNTEIGVAQTVLNKLLPEHEIFIVEMGAYKKGEIKAICDIVKPKIGIITALGPQHLGLFGSMENILETKFELIDSLPENGLALINGDNKMLKTHSQNLKISPLFFGLNKSADISATDIEEKIDDLEFNLKITENERVARANTGLNLPMPQAGLVHREPKQGETITKVHFQTSLLGRPAIYNLLASISVAKHLGMNFREIVTAVKSLPDIPKTMQKIDCRNGITIIDESYNANPEGVIAALDYLKLYDKAKSKPKKVIIMPSMLELGKNSHKEHQRVAQKIAGICDYAFFLDKNHRKALEKGLGERKKSSCKIFFESNPSKIIDIIKKEIGYNCVLLFESRGAEKVIKEFTR